MDRAVQVEDDIWAGDLLGRKAEGEYLCRYIERLYDSDKKEQTSFVLNVNSEWGHGKTWFLKNLYKELKKNHPVVYFDAWKNDFSNDALLSFVSVVCDGLSALFWKNASVSQKVTKVKKAFSSISSSALPILVSVLVKQLTGKGLDELGLSDDVKSSFVDASDELSKVVSTAAIDSFITQKNAIDNFSNAVESLVKEIRNDFALHLPICIMVDELDRCRPTYAIELLEAIKHLFSINGIFFILASDTRQLAHSIKAIYGQGFESHAYLKRFFYAEYQLAMPDYEKMANYLFDSISFEQKIFIPEPLETDYGMAGLFSKIAQFFNLTVRDQEQVFSIFKTICLMSDKNGIHFVFILFLICIKHKFGVAADIFFERKNDTQLNEIFSKNVLSTRAAMLQSRRQESGHIDKNVEFNIRDIFDFYLSLLRTDINHSSFKYERYEFHYQRNVILNLLAGKTRNPQTAKFDENHDLMDYFNLLSQAGRISIG
ncbi:MAG TPA: P-loop NTPase fold protein [Cellvibrio sp.]|nr:P-loop NTPase fold protein [Cellvibrio sp.]